MPEIVGLATSTPDFGVSHEIASEMAKSMSCDDASQHRTVDALYRRTKIANRGSVLLDAEVDAADGEFRRFYPEAATETEFGPSTKVRADRYTEEAPRLAIPAAADALAAAEIDGGRVTHLVTVSCTGFSAPGVDIALIKSLELPATTQRIAVGFMGCHGAINGLRAAAAIAASDPDAIVLMVSVELCSLHYQYGFDPDRIVSGALFADGAAAAVLRHGGDESQTAPRWVASGCCLVPDSEDEMTWRIGDNGYQMTLSSRVPTLIEQQLRPYLETFLAQHGESIDSIGGWAVHPGGPRILDAVQTSLALAPEQLATSRQILSQHGNMSSATMMFILRQFMDVSQPGPWLMLGFGPGLEIETTLIKVPSAT